MNIGGLAVKAGSRLCQFQVERAWCEENPVRPQNMAVPDFPVAVWVESSTPNAACVHCGGDWWLVPELIAGMIHDELGNTVRAGRRGVCSSMGRIIE